eukprot:CAMPEP_0198289204 /NCGR_PEP_ID=MMETSP1449-20131203/7479_1 /TAXON_ID=420275 /ORGANISM="Attheya septentrionalis, Strain CCMP2084" /LENGTH=158 /DNA_ID=CAMNT_0043987501 /DNA_START=336 /DNA_END=812 /DNA_ORIENTATION=+
MSPSSCSTIPQRKRKLSCGSNLDVLLTIGEDAPDMAPWKTENILVNGAPKEAEWWEDERDDDADDAVNNNDCDKNIESVSSSSEEKKEVFHNRGFEAWEKSRAAWRKRTVLEKRPDPPSYNQSEIIKGLTPVARSYELPGRVGLTELVGLFQYIWNGK